MNLSSTHLVRASAAVCVAAAWLLVFTRPGMKVLAAVAITAILLALVHWHTRWRYARALATIRRQPLPSFLKNKLLATHPGLSEAALRDVERGLRQFFMASARAEGRFVAMPSKVVDTLWHEFILHTRGYEAFCRKAFGRLLHHTPAEALPAGQARNPMQHEGLRRAWYWACREENLDPRRPGRLPLLFALDATLGIAGGYVYALDCSAHGGFGAGGGEVHCATHLSAGSCGGSSSASGCGGDAGSTSSSLTSSCGSNADSSNGGSGSSGDGGGGGDGGGSGCGGGGGD